ncbi:shikimate dehydrogenase, partial [Nonlabens mediterrranea]|nr:shikimate dehydrogenase [Nonlabens mediterrranea]
MDNRQIPHSVFGLIGQRLDYSFSKAYFTEKFEKLGLDDYEYRNFEIKTEDDLLRFRESVINHP